jgi:glucose/arabinose dehydrogenase
MRIRGLLFALICGAVVPSAAQYGPTPVNLPQAALNGKLHVPDGFKVTAFAFVPGARLMAVGPDGSVYVSQPRSDNVIRLVDANADGVAESQTVAVSGVRRAHGLAFHNGYLYVAGGEGVYRVKLNASGTPEGTPERLNTYSSGGNHWSRTVIFGSDGAMYVSIGSTCNVCEESNADRATVMRYDENGKNGRIFSSGLRNAVGLAVHPTTHEIWAAQNERDDLEPDHQNLPPEEINILKDGANYGWPYCYGERIPNPEFRNAGKCENTVPPALMMQAHSAPLGISFLDKATMLPAEFRGDALVAFHGSWDRDVPTGAKVVRIRIRDGKPVSYEDFITGWQDENGRRWGRPVDVVVNKDGSVLVSDDAGGAIYRVWK